MILVDNALNEMVSVISRLSPAKGHKTRLDAGASSSFQVSMFRNEGWHNMPLAKLLLILHLVFLTDDKYPQCKAHFVRSCLFACYFQNAGDLRVRVVFVFAI